MDATVIVFDDWESTLKAQAPEDRYRGYREAIVKFRYWLRETGKPADAATFKEHLNWKRSYLTPDRFSIRLEALRWYYQEGRKRMVSRAPSPKSATPMPANEEPESHPGQGGRIDTRLSRSRDKDNLPKPVGERRFGDYRVYGMTDVPTAGSRDLGGPSWEKALIRRIREKNLAWKSEKTYRSWCRRFMAVCGNKPIEDLDHRDIHQWLSDLAVRDRVAVATQSQALNAVVFSSVKF